MAIEFVNFTLGPLGNNTYLVGDTSSQKAVVIDPTFDSNPILDEIAQRGWELHAIWITHAHFDHIAGVNTLISKTRPKVLPVALHADDLPLWREGGGARHFGFFLPALQPPTELLKHQEVLNLGAEQFEVRHTPGHSPGHVIFYHAGQKLAFCGDVIFYRGVGRTDLPGASGSQLANSICTQVYTLPPDTRLLSGHGPETTVGDEMHSNPFIQP